ncbi:MAG TPA: MFS transporter [Sphingomonas sp.]
MRKRHIVLGLLGLASVLTFLDRMAIAVTGESIQKELAIGPKEWGWILSAYVIAYSIFEIPSGAMGDRHGYRRELTRIATWWSFFTAATAWCRTAWQMAGARFLFGLGAAGAYPNMSGVLYRWFPPRERARGQGVIWGAGRLGGALAPLLLVPLEAHAGWRVVFVALGIAGGLWAIAWWSFFRERPADQPGITAGELAEIGEPEGHGHAGTPWRALLSLPALRWIAIAYACYAWASWFYFSWFPIWLVHAGGFSQAEMGIYASLPFFLGFASNLVGGWLSDRLAARIGMRRAYAGITSVCLLVTAALMFAMSFAHAKFAIVALCSVSFAVMDLMLPAAWAMCMAIGGRCGGTATGVMNTAGNVGGFLCTLVFGYVIAATGNYELPVRGVAGMVMIAALIFARIDCTRGLDAKAAPER